MKKPGLEIVPAGMAAKGIFGDDAGPGIADEGKFEVGLKGFRGDVAVTDEFRSLEMAERRGTFGGVPVVVEEQVVPLVPVNPHFPGEELMDALAGGFRNMNIDAAEGVA
jgi:hypothetical protein